MAWRQISAARGSTVKPFAQGTTVFHGFSLPTMRDSREALEMGVSLQYLSPAHSQTILGSRAQENPLRAQLQGQSCRQFEVGGIVNIKLRKYQRPISKMLASLCRPWLLPLFHLAAVGHAAECMESECLSVSNFLQTKTHLEPQVKPWHVYDYLTANYHKSGVYMTNEIHNMIFTILGAAEEGAMGTLEFPCYWHSAVPLCYNMDAPILRFTDGFNASWRAAHTGIKPRKVAGSIRDPLQMVASAYCYHHEGKEIVNVLMPVKELLVLGPEAGTELCAQWMLPVIEWMASVFADPDYLTLALTFEEFTNSSEGFDASINRLLDHYFGTGDDLISKDQRSQIQEAVKAFDEIRNPAIDNTTANSMSTTHSSDPECKKKASEAVMKMDPVLLKKYQELQRRLGYPVQVTT